MAEKDAASSSSLVNCLMLVTWPQRRQMVQDAIVSYVQQEHTNRTLTVVNDGDPCELSAAFAASGCRGRVLHVRAGATIGEKRNAGAAAEPGAAFIASFDDDDFSLPSRLRLQVARMGPEQLWLSASRKFIALHECNNVVGFELGRCYGAGMMGSEVLRVVQWPHVSYCEDHRLYAAARRHPRFASSAFVEADDLVYVHRRHETNVSAARRSDLWQGVLPLPLGGTDAVRGAEEVRRMLATASNAEEYLGAATAASVAVN